MARKRASMREGPLAELFRATEAAQKQAEHQEVDPPPTSSDQERLVLDETVEWACARQQGGARIYDYQGVSFPLADSAADAAAGRLLTLSVAALADAGADAKVIHHKASMAKLFVTEAAQRAALAGLQLMGGYGASSEYDMQRHVRETLLSTIYGGTSEIQRGIIAKALGL